MSRPDPQSRIDARIERARARADLARMRFATALGNTRDRVSPGRLREDAATAVSDKVTEVKQAAQASIRRHPIRTGAIVTGALAVMFWKPARLTALVGARVAQLVWLNRSVWRSKE